MMEVCPARNQESNSQSDPRQPQERNGELARGEIRTQKNMRISACHCQWPNQENRMNMEK